MSLRKKINILALGVLFVGFFGLAPIGTTFAAESTVTCNDGTVLTPPSTPDAAEHVCDSHGGIKTSGSGSGSSINPEPNQLVTNAAGDCGDENGSCIMNDIQIAINVLSIGIGLIIAGSIAFAGLQYMTARDNPQAVSAAKNRIINSVIALIAFVFIYAFLQWVVPGGIFS